VNLIVENSGDLLKLNTICDCNKFGYVIPEQGSNIWVDSMVILVEAEHKALAEAFIDYILDPVVSADISNATRYATPNKAAVEQKLVNADLLDNPSIYPFESLQKKMFFLTVLKPDENRFYAEAWSEIKILAGQGLDAGN